MSFSFVFPPRRGRSHEATGPGAPAFAAILCGMGKAALWLVEDWRGAALNPQGLAPFCDPDRLIVVHASGQTEMLAAMEEALRSGAVDTVVAELSRPLGLTEGRRLQLAAEAGRSLGLCLYYSHGRDWRHPHAPNNDLWGGSARHYQRSAQKAPGSTIRACWGPPGA